jgi:transporter family-2 protein
MLNLAGPLPLAVAAGVSIVVQQVLNSNLRTALNAAAWSGFMSYRSGSSAWRCSQLSCATPFQPPVSRPASHGGPGAAALFGAIFIGLAILLVPHLGATTFIALLVTGQMLTSVAFNHFRWFGLVQRPIDVPRLIGVALLIGGVVPIRR